MSSVDAVPKPPDAGAGVLAIANTRIAFANLRSGPDTEYNDIGNIRDNSLIRYYPDSRTANDWLYVDYNGVSGWVSDTIIDFEAAIGDNPATPGTPYDGKVAVWHWKSSVISANTIDEFAQDLKQRAPNVGAVFVKASDGTEWQGAYDSGQLAINGPDDIDRWVSTLQRYDLDFHAWCVPAGTDLERETALINAVCQRPGVKSMILDVEPYTGFWQGGREQVRPYMLAIRREIGGEFHIGLSVDPRSQHFDSIFPQEWYPFVNSLHPQTYWYTFRVRPEVALQNMYDVWRSYGRPIIPVLQADAPLVDQIAAHTLATQRHGAPGLSWWRYGVIAQYGAVNLPVEPRDPSDDDNTGGDNFADEVLITPGGDGFRKGTYTDDDSFQQFDGTWNWPVFYTDTESGQSNVWAEWRTELPQSGRYEIATFVPARHATTERARFKVHGIKGTDTEVVIDINQARNRNRWVSLGIFELEKEQMNAGRVFLNDKTGEEGLSIAFDAIRFRRIISQFPGDDGGDDENGDGIRPGDDIVDGVPVADGYDSPIGTADQRGGSKIWPSGWLDASPFGQLYFVGTPSEAYHTGADLNWGRPYEDKGMPVYSTANGVVTFAGSLRVWGNVIVIRHDPLYTPNGQVLYSRYGHVQEIMVEPGERVERGQQIAEIGDAFGRFVPHLHFDISPTTVLEIRPSDWPGTNRAALLKNYINPRDWIRSNRP